MARFTVALMGFGEGTDKAVSAFADKFSTGSSIPVDVYKTTTAMAAEVCMGRDTYPQVIVISKNPTDEELEAFERDLMDILDVLEVSDSFHLVGLFDARLNEVYSVLQQIHSQSRYTQVPKIIPSAICSLILGSSTEVSTVATSLGQALDNLNRASEQVTEPVDDGVVPMVDDGVVPMIDDGVVPMVDDGVVPMVDDGVVPMVDDEVVPMVDDDVVIPTIENNPTPPVTPIIPVTPVVEPEPVVPVVEPEPVVPVVEPESVVPTIDDEVVPVVEDEVTPTIEPEPEMAMPEMVDTPAGTIPVNEAYVPPQPVTPQPSTQREKGKGGLFSKVFGKQKLRGEAIESSVASIQGVTPPTTVGALPDVMPPSPVPETMYAPQQPVSTAPTKPGRRASARAALQQQVNSAVPYCSRNKVLAVTGLHNSGVTTTAASIAFTAASLGVETLLIDADMTNRSLSYMFDGDMSSTNFLARGGMTQLLKQRRFDAPMDFAINPFLNLFVVSGNLESVLEYHSDASVELTVEALTSILNNGRMKTQLTIVDIPLEFILQNPRIMSTFDDLIFTVPASSYGVDRYLGVVQQGMFKSPTEQEEESNYIEFINKLRVVLTQCTGRCYYNTCQECLAINSETFTTIIYDIVADETSANVDIITQVPVKAEFLFLPDVGNQYVNLMPAAAYEDSDIGPLFKSICVQLLNNLN